MKKGIIILAAVVLAVALAAGSFYGGMAYQRNQANQIRNQFLASRGLTANGAGNGSTQRRSFFGGGGATGQVKSISGNTLSISTAQNVTTVNLSNSTRIEKAAPGAVNDIQPGEQVIVSGQRDTSGNINATQVLILGSSPQNAGNLQNPGSSQNRGSQQSQGATP
jgi:hypothetical protein